MLPRLFLVAFLGTMSALLVSSPREERTLEKRVRRPVALGLADSGKRLLVANRKSGTISVLDVARRRVESEINVGRALADLVVSDKNSRVLAVDDRAHQLIVMKRRDAHLDIVARVDVPAYPVSVLVSADGTRCFVGSLWSRALTIVSLDEKPRARATIDLPFSPRKQVLAPDGEHLVVADAFGGRLAVIDIRRAKLVSVEELPGHNIRGLALADKGTSLVLTHQVLARRTAVSKVDIHWGNILTNNVRSLRLDAVLDPERDLLMGSRLDYLGEPGRGAADPSEVAVSTKEARAIALAGVGEVALRSRGEEEYRRVRVGQRPTALAFDATGERVFVANTFDDSVSIVDVGKGKLASTIALGPRPEPSRIEQGKHLFFDGRLSHEGWFSCHSCHSDGHTPGLLADTLTDGTNGTPKRIPSLLGTRGTAPWGWTGSMATLDEQIHSSIRKTMHGKPIDKHQTSALVEYLRSLPPPPTPKALGRKPEPAAVRGRALFTKLDCIRCHVPPLYTSAKVYDVGLRDESGVTKFNPPSLRGVLHRDRFFHDNRAGTLEAVFENHRHQLERKLSREELADLLAFLKSL